MTICNDSRKNFGSLKRKNVDASLKTIHRRIKDLEALELIEQKPIKQGRKNIGSVFTVFRARDQYRALEPQGIEQSVTN